MTRPFRIGLTADFRGRHGELAWGDIGLSLLTDEPGITWEYLAPHGPALSAADVAGFDGILVNGAAVTASTVSGTHPPAVMARFGVGYDAVDVEVCTRSGVLVTNTPTGVRRPVALASLTLLLSLAHRVKEKDALVRDGRWAERIDYRGHTITGATLGVVGLGNIGREVFRLAAPLGMRHLATDPHVDPADLDDRSITLVPLPQLLADSDYVVLLVPLTEHTTGLIGADQLRMMKPTAFLINMARGAVVDEPALVDALRDGVIRGAGIDVFRDEPLPTGSPLVELQNTVLSPHALCWTDELALGNGTEALRSLVDVARHRVPPHVVNPDALSHPRFAGFTLPKAGAVR